MSGEVSRDLRVDAKHPHTGEDVGKLQRAANRRLDARGQTSYKCPEDGHFGPKTARACRRAIFLLGALETTALTAGEGHVTIGAQRMIRYPGRRSPQQLDRARSRMTALVREQQAKAAKEAKAHVGIHVMTDAMQLLLDHAPAVHYTQGAQRWEGIRRHLHAADGEYPHFADCSAAVSWAGWQLWGDGPDRMNGSAWTAGFTGSLLMHGHHVSHDTEGCLALYGSGWPGKHVVYCTGNGRGISHGSEAAPFEVDLDYRGDLMMIRSYT